MNSEFSKNGKKHRKEDDSSEDEVLYKRVEVAKPKPPEENVWNLGGKKQIKIIEFKGKNYIDIREYYEKDGQTLPGKKGICLQFDQFQEILNSSEDVVKKFKAMKKN